MQCVHCCSLAFLTECVLCPNGHRFCLECLGQWSHRKQLLQNYDDDDDDDAIDFNFDQLQYQSWLGILESYSVFPFNRDTVVRDPVRMLSARHARLRHAAALPNIRSGPKIRKTRRFTVDRHAFPDRSSL